MAIGTVADVLHEMLKSFDTHYSGFDGWPNNNAAILDRWANVADKLMSGVIPQSLTSVQARAAFIQTLQPLNYNVPFIPLMQAALTTYATVLASGMTGYVGVPPPLPAPIVLGAPIEYGAPVFTAMAIAWVTWAKTGTAIQGSAVINWN